MRWIRLLILLVLLGFALPFLDGFFARQRAESLGAQGAFAEASREATRAAERLPFVPSLWLRAGLFAYQAGDYATARARLEVARQRGALTLDGWDVLGLACWKSGDVPSALQYWQEGLSQLGPSAQLYARLALAYRELEEWEAEKEALQHWVELEGDEAYPHYRLGLLLLNEALLPAEAELSSASALDPRLAPAVETLRRALSLARQTPDETRRLILLGRALGTVEEWKLAQRLFEQATQHDPANGEAWAWLAEARQHTGQPLRDELERAWRLAPRSATVHLLRGLYAFRHADEVTAIREFLQAIELQPDEFAPWVALGEAYAQHGELPLALSAYRKATQLAPDQVEPWRALATFCATYGVEIAETGLPAARQAVTLAPAEARNLDTLGWLLLLNGDLDEAERTLQQAITQEPELAAAHLHLGMLYLYRGRADLARSHLMEVLRLAPDSPLATSARNLLGGE